MANQSLYGACKAGVRSLTESLDAEWAPDGIRVRSLMPSFIDTPLLQGTPTASATGNPRGGGRHRARVHPGRGSRRRRVAAVTGDKLHWLVGKSARQMRLMAEWAPGSCASAPA